MATTVHGIHHVTAIAGDAQQNLDFYVGVLGMRLVKKSVNQDDPGTYHFFYADGVGTPGTDLTFFPWQHLRPGRMGTGLTIEVQLSVPRGSLTYWRERMDQHNVAVFAPETRFDEQRLPFRDPHGMQLAFVENDDERPFVPWDASPVPAEYQIRGMHGVHVWERELGPTQALLTQALGFELLASEGEWHRFVVEGGGSGKLLDVRVVTGKPPGAWGTGGVHHVAWRTRDEDHEMAVREAVANAGLHPTELIDRFWFQSVYFREPGGVLFELATDGPGFDRDEDLDALGEKLILPPWLEARRDEIEAALPKVTIPKGRL